MTKNTASWCSRKKDLQCVFPLDVLMILSSVIVVTDNSEYLMCGRFFLGKTVCLKNFEFIAAYSGGLSLSPRRGTQPPLSWTQLVAGINPAMGHDRGLHRGVSLGIKWG
jgi:hypothetical protein